MKADRAFDELATRDPLFAVVPAPEYRTAALTEATRAKFFEDGDALVQALVRTIELRLAPLFAPTSILEYGCGVGRLAFPLARLAKRRGGFVTAVDRSMPMLDRARRFGKERALDNITFAGPSELFAQPAQFDFIVCYGLLQRLRPDEGIRLIHRLLRLILPGGIVAFQFPLWTHASWATRFSRRTRLAVPAVNALVNLSRGVRPGEPLIPSYTYDPRPVLAAFSHASVPAAHLVFDNHGDLQGVVALG